MIDTNALFTQALGITDPWYISEVQLDSQKKRLDIKISFKRGSTFSYKDEDTGEESDYKVYDTQEKIWRHLDFFEHECYLNVRVPRIKTPDGKTHVVAPPWSGKVHGFTLLLESRILERGKHTPVHQVGSQLGLSDHKLWTVLDKYVDEAKASEDWSDFKALGVDETSQAKGHKYISLFVDLEKRKTVHVADGKSHSTFKDFSKQLKAHGGDSKNIEEVSCDMSPAFIKGVKENLPNAKITFDKFHIVKVINEGVDVVRREEVKSNPLLKKTRYIFLKNEKNLNSKQSKQREELSLPKLKIKSIRALHIRESFQDIYSADTVEEFEMLLKKWYFWATHSQLEPMIKAAKTIRNHWDGVLRWKESQISNGILEGLNSVVQAAKRKARGYKNRHCKTMVYLLTGCLDFHILNPHCRPS